MTAAVSAWLQRLHLIATDRAFHRNLALAANDGIIATAGILEGFTGAGANDATLIMAALAATVAGMLTAGGAKWTEVATERDAQLRALDEERAEIKLQPDAELFELAAYYQKKGLSQDLAHQVARELMIRSPLKAQLESEHHILDALSRADVIQASVGSTVAYGLGAAIPFAITVVVPVCLETGVVLAAVVASLTMTSIVGARAGHISMSNTLIRSLVIGIGTIGVSYFVGQIVF